MNRTLIVVFCSRLIGFCLSYAVVSSFLFQWITRNEPRTGGVGDIAFAGDFYNEVALFGFVFSFITYFILVFLVKKLTSE